MTEEEYLQISNLASLRDAVSCLRSVLFMDDRQKRLNEAYSILYPELIISLEKEIEIAE